MATSNYFPKKSESAPMIYAYEDKYDPNLKGILKVGYTTIGVQERVHFIEATGAGELLLRWGASRSTNRRRR